MSKQDKPDKELISYRQVFPNDANPSGNMFGGRVMEIMDSTAGMAAGRYSKTVNPVTASVEAITFRLPVYIGDMLKTVNTVVYTGRTSMVVKVDVYRFEKGLDPGELCTCAHYIFVAMDSDRKPTPVPALEVSTDAEKKSWQIAEAVREQSLALNSL